MSPLERKFQEMKFPEALKATDEFVALATPSVSTNLLKPVAKSDYLGYIGKEGIVNVNDLAANVHKVMKDTSPDAWKLAQGRTSSWVTSNLYPDRAKGVVERVLDENGVLIKGMFRLKGSTATAKIVRATETVMSPNAAGGQEKDVTSTPPVATKPKAKN